MATREDIAKMVLMLSAAFPNWKTNEYTLEVYYQDLQDIDTQELMVASKHCRSQSGRQFAPSTGELRGAVAELRGLSSNMPSSFQAWQEVLAQVGAVGSYGKPSFSHPLVDRAVRAMGWRELCLSENQTADRARFIQCYEQLQEREATADMLLPEVRGYLEVNGAQLPAPADQIKQLTARMAK